MHENLFILFRERVAVLPKNNFSDIYPASVDLNAEYAVSDHPVPYPERLTLTYKPVREGDVWGKTWDSAWFHLTGTVPASFAGKELCLRLNTGSELLLFDENGVPLYGFTGSSVFDTKYCKECYPLGMLEPGSRIDLWCEAAANGLCGITLPSAEEKDPPAPLGSFSPAVKSLRLCVFDRETWLFLLELETLADLLKCYDRTDYRGKQLLHALNQAVDVYAYNPANSPAARQVLKKTVFSLKAEDGALLANTIGHAHIDVGWLWPVRESTRKAARTFSSQLALMEQYPEFKFGASQPYLYQQIKEHYPALYRKIRQRVKEGRWELQGGMYVEADCNLISGESMVRQFLHGKNFFMDEFGINVRTLWIPDVFGYSAALPQIIRQAQCDWFLTQKISWSQINQFPYHTFRWVGVDGSSVLTHFPPENTYNAQPSAARRTAAANRFNEGGFLPGFMSLVGIGDGGGGPSENHVERCRILSNLRGCPKSEWKFASDFFRELDKRQDELPQWQGELYLEFHRGTLTTQGRTKRGNRKCEQALTGLEIMASGLPPEKWPRRKLDQSWKNLLLNQFHDILPGSSIREVYERAEKEYAQILAMAEEETAEVCRGLFRRNEQCAVLANTLSGSWHGIVELPEGWNGCAVLDESGKELPSQLRNGRTQLCITLPGSSFRTIRKGAPKQVVPEDSGDRVLENELIRYEFNSAGRLIRAFDKELNQEFLAGEGNVFSLYNDRPLNFDAWEVEVYYPRDQKGVLECVFAGTVFKGPAGGEIEFRYRTEKSELHQTVVLAPGTRRLDFITRVNWQESRTLLRTSFPVAITADRAAYDIQYAYVERPTHNNTSWEQAKFEVCGHRYADLSDRDCGVALLNDCKYGYCVKGSTLDLALLRSPKYPDRSADQGEHCFTYSFLPHAGSLADSNVMQEAAGLNRTPTVADGLETGGREAVCSVEADGISLEVVKRAEKNDSLILRLVEIRGRHSAGTLRFSERPEKVFETDLLEWKTGAALSLSGNILPLRLKPFEILTLCAVMKN